MQYSLPLLALCIATAATSCGTPRDGVDASDDADSPYGDDDSQAGDPVDSSSDATAAGRGDTADPGCLSDRLTPPSGENCACDYDSCNAQQLTCHCSLSCYRDDCLIAFDESGNPVSADGTLAECGLSCTTEDDLSEEMTCTAVDCILPMIEAVINPVAPPDAPTAAVELERAVQNVDVVFVVDNSGSMTDNQMAAACAVVSFTTTAGADGASYQTGVLTTDMFGDREAPGNTYDQSTGEFLNPPSLQRLDGSCTTTLQCDSGSCNASLQDGQICDFALGGDFVDSADPASGDLLRQLIVQGDRGSNQEGGLEQAFQFYAQQERLGAFDESTPKEIVVISDEDADATGTIAGTWLCPFDRVDRNTTGIPDFNPPQTRNTAASCTQDLINFYTYYFTSRGIVVHGLLYKRSCPHESTESAGVIYEAVAQATGGHVENICECSNFGGFFANVGDSTSVLSTNLCFPGATMPDMTSATVTYLETNEVVEPGATEGWSTHPSLPCLVMNGSWKERMGRFRIDYIDPDIPAVIPDPVACLEPAPALPPHPDALTVTCDGQQVPPSSADGYTLDANSCFTFHGSYQSLDGRSCVVQYI